MFLQGKSINPNTILGLDWNNITVAAILGVAVYLMYKLLEKKRKEEREDAKRHIERILELEKKIEDLQDKRLDDKDKSFNILLEIENENRDSFDLLKEYLNKLSLKWQVYENTGKNDNK